MEIKCPAGTFAVPDEFTLREMRSIKQLTGLLPGQIEEALDQGDLDIVLALVIVGVSVGVSVVVGVLVGVSVTVGVGVSVGVSVFVGV